MILLLIDFSFWSSSLYSSGVISVCSPSSEDEYVS